jgi:hypothetical protein
MIKPLTIGAALSDQHLLGAALGPTESWIGWLAVLKAAFAETLTEQELVHFATVAGDRPLPDKRVRELWAIVGRRGGKTRIAAAILTYLAVFVDHRSYLSPGETGYVLCLSLSKDQAELTHGYCRAFLEESPILRKEIVKVTQTEIELRNRITISTHTNSFRTVRGRTIVACVFDESAFWRDDSSANPDDETYRAVLPALLTTKGMLVGISSPYRRAGLLHTKHRDHYGNASNEDVLRDLARPIQLERYDLSRDGRLSALHTGKSPPGNGRRFASLSAHQPRSIVGPLLGCVTV